MRISSKNYTSFENATPKEIATFKIEEAILCGLTNISNDMCLNEEFTERQQEIIMEQAKKVAHRLLIKLDASWKNNEVSY